MSAPSTRRKVTAKSVGLSPSGDILEYKAEDYVAPEHAEAWAADARAKGWQTVTIGDEDDHGPGGADGAYALHPDVVALLPEDVRAAHLDAQNQE